MNKIKTDDYNLELDNMLSVLKKNKQSNKVSNILLYREYLNKLNKCRIALGGESQFKDRGEFRKFNNLFLNISASWTTELKTQEEFNIDLINKNFKVSGGRKMEDLFIYLYIYWELCKDFAEIKTACNFNPYLLMIKIINRSEVIYVYNGDFNIDAFTYNNLEKYYSYELPSIEDDFLD